MTRRRRSDDYNSIWLRLSKYIHLIRFHSTEAKFIYSYYIVFFSFMLYFENLVLKHSIALFPPIVWDISCLCSALYSSIVCMYACYSYVGLYRRNGLFDFDDTSIDSSYPCVSLKTFFPHTAEGTWESCVMMSVYHVVVFKI